MNYEIEGGIPLYGSIKASGSKNICLAIMAGALLCKGQTTLSNVPHITDVYNMMEVIKSLGVKCEFDSIQPNTIIIDATNITNVVTEFKYVSKMRASFNVLGPILARKGEASVSRPGGCNIGNRPIDLHIMALQKLGAEVIDTKDMIRMRHNGLKGAGISFDTITVGGTQHAITGATLAEGETIIVNAAIEPEVTSLIDFLNQAGANIVIDKQNTIKIYGVNQLNGINFRIPFDRIEAGTYLAFGAMTKGDITIEDVDLNHIYSFLYKLEEIGVNIEQISGTKEYLSKVRVYGTNKIKACNLSTAVFPGFPTDLQPVYSTLMTIADGVSKITENIFSSRFKFMFELQRMGANCDCNNNSNVAIVIGINELNGAKEIIAPDLRGGTALICAALGAKGTSIIEDKHGYISRGYENIVEKITSLGGKIKLFESE